MLDEREFELMNIIRLKLAANQRDLSRHMGLSLGMINMLIRRLVTKGYIRIRELNKKKVEYMLTPKGFAEKMQKSVKYTLNTINAIGMVKRGLREIVGDLHKKQVRDFYILGDGDLGILVENTLRESCGDGFRVSHVAEIPSEKVPGVFLVCKESYQNGTQNRENTVNVIEELAKGDWTARYSTEVA